MQKPLTEQNWKALHLEKFVFKFLVLLIKKCFKLDEFTVCLRVRHYQYPISTPRTSENTHTTIEGILARLEMEQALQSAKTYNLKLIEMHASFFPA